MFIPVFCLSQNELPDSIVDQLKFGVKGFSERYHTPAIVVAIVHDKKIIFDESLGYIDVENKIPATIDSKFPLLSVGKTFTATMLMQLYERKVVALDDDVRKYVPEYKLPGTTLLQLATHTSGLPRNSPADINFTKKVDRWLLAGKSYPALEPATNKQFLHSLQFIKKEYPDYELLSYGDRHYSNMGYSLLGIALERAAKKDFPAYIVSNICNPLQMNNTGIGTESYGNNILAKGYYYNDSLKTFIKTPVFKANSALYAGGIYSTATDLAKFISFQFDKSDRANKVLASKNRAMMYSFRIAWKPSYPFVFHEGAMLGYRCEVAFNPEIKIGWVILTNTTDFDFSKMNEYFSRLLSPLFNTKPVPVLDKYAGTYLLAGGYDSLKIYLKEGKLYSTYLQNEIPQTALTDLGHNKFKAQEKGNYNISYEFIQNENGEIKMLNMGQLVWIKK
jgi:CubicO group peptidase (beta-lactamase class C family)